MTFLRVLVCAVLLSLRAASVHGFSGVPVLPKQIHTSSSQLGMAWTLPTAYQATFQPSWYQDCGNPTKRQVVYADVDPDRHDDEFYRSYFRSGLSHDPTSYSVFPERETPPRGARIGRAARRALRNLRAWQNIGNP